jgi:hypothetical protein
MRVDEAKAAGTFDETRDAYNEEAEAMGSDYRMDHAGGIRKSYLKAKPKYVKTPAKKQPIASKTPRVYRPTAQKITDTTSPEGLLAMATKARRRNTLVIP